MSKEVTAGLPGRVFIFDSTAFYAGLPFAGTLHGYTTPQVLSEISHGKRGPSVEGILEAGRLKLEDASVDGLEKARRAASVSGDLRKLSAADLSVIALAVDFKGKMAITLVSDDYALLNVAKILGLDHASTSMKTEMKLFRWLWYCPGCGKTYRDRAREVCDVCGSELKRKRRA